MLLYLFFLFFFFKQKTAYEMRISDWSSDVCSSDLRFAHRRDRDLAHGGIVVEKPAEHSDLEREGERAFQTAASDRLIMRRDVDGFKAGGCENRAHPLLVRESERAGRVRLDWQGVGSGKSV